MIWPPRFGGCQIVAKVEQLMALVDALEQQLAASRATTNKVLHGLVAELTEITKNHSVARPISAPTEFQLPLTNPTGNSKLLLSTH